MKKAFFMLMCFLLLCECIVFADTSVIPEKEYELWSQSPYITSGFTADDIRIYKAYNMGVLELYPLAEIGDRYYLAVCPDKNTNGGYNGKTKTTDFYFYTIYLTDGGFIILSDAYTTNEYYWDRGYSFANIANQINASYYTNNNSEIPMYILNPSGRYSNSNYTEYDEYFYITDRGKIYTMCEDAEYGAEGYPYIKNNILYKGQDRNPNNSSYPYYYMSDNSTKASNSCPIFFTEGVISYGTATRVAVSEMTVSNGYNIYKTDFDSDLMPAYMKVPGTADLYLLTQYTAEYNTSAKVFNYNIKVWLYKLTESNMNLQKTGIISTGNTSINSYSCKELTSLDTAYYSNEGYGVPKILIGDYGVITIDGKIVSISLNPSVYTNNHYHIAAYNQHLAVVRSYTGSNYIYHTNPATGSNCYWQVINEININSGGNINLTADLELPISSTANAGQDGYFSSYSTWREPSFNTAQYTELSSWWNRTLTNVFPDQRTVRAGWMTMGNGLAELWYDIYNADGRLRSTGPTGYSTYFSSVSDRYELITFAINNTKFLVGIADVGRTFLLEYYRVAVVSESDTGEVSGKTEFGQKNITPPIGSDTEVVQSLIDFGQSDLPIGYNIKNNVIDSAKLDVGLREQINTIRLNDIIILKKSGYISGEQNTGVTLNSYSDYDYSFGSSYVRFYTNGQYLRWYCNYPNNLAEGTYDKSFSVGDKKIYVTIKVIIPPSNSESTTVVF